ncbi:DnaJ-domain-containing protein [Alternaria alternata]|uniref:DnaJ-domain-containing protein n=1 Tax=Alternaria alternata TaxID=5599 RepID=A0A177DFX8_ALTAL|nr:DnaJ-domain-containing protein [Alternaria alternata]OAG18167.1 DnaJ-domain-containing protein [Alternaria alternata]
MSFPANHYQILGVDIQADDAAIKKAYKKLALENHPDKTLHLSAALVERRTKIFKLATTAYEILLDPVQRAKHDKTLAQHPFTSGTPPGPIGTTPSPWFYAPVSESPIRTNLSFLNHAGWHFRIEVSKKYKWILRPVLPLLNADTEGDIMVRISVQRNTYSATVNALKDVVIDVKATPGNKSTALSSVFKETRQGIELCVTIGTLPVTATAPLPPMPAWSWSFDVDLGFLIPFYKELRVSHLMFYPHYPSHAVGKDGAVPAKEPFPMGSPQAELVSLFEGIQFVAMSKGFYCEEVGWAGRKRWRLAAVGSV